MIRVSKSIAIPAKLSGDGVAENKRNEDAYDKNKRAYINNKKRFTIESKIYNHHTVKTSLKKAQYAKCCFCEKDQSDEYGAVEHYRPKAGYKQVRKTPLNKPGYYWLGYDWKNLYFVCSPCNTHKGNIFPLADQTKRATSHHDNVTNEEPYLLDPGGIEDPRDHIVFDSEFVRGKSLHGVETINACRLNRNGLNEKRKKLLSDIDFHLVIILDEKNQSIDTVKKSRKILRKCRNRQAEFSAAIIDFLSKSTI